MTDNASSLVDRAKQWATHYGSFTKGEESAVLSVPLRARAAWDDNDAGAFADVFVENGSILLGDLQLTDRESIRSHMAREFTDRYRGSRISEEPLEVKFLEDDVAVVLTQGGIVLDGEVALPAEREVRTTWVTVRRGGEWKLAAQQSSPIAG